MIITKEEIEGFERSLEEDFAERRAEEEDRYAHWWAEFPGLTYLYKNPHLLMALGFDEYRLLEWTEENEAFIEKAFPRIEEIAFPLEYESLYRSEKSGEWSLFQGLMPQNTSANLSLNFVGSAEEKDFSTSDLLSKLQTFSKEPKQETSSLILPSLWTPEKQAFTKIELVESTRKIIEEIHKNIESMNSVHWRTLEEIVAELLRSQGMQIHLTPRSGDGGRDVIARGELIPGEPMTLAIEVKRKSIVGVGDVRSALYANQSYPGLLVATSGRFSAGVIKEKKKNALRLFLKDGVALQQWVDLYCRKNKII